MAGNGVGVSSELPLRNRNGVHARKRVEELTGGSQSVRSSGEAGTLFLADGHVALTEHLNFWWHWYVCTTMPRLRRWPKTQTGTTDLPVSPL